MLRLLRRTITYPRELRAARGPCRGSSLSETDAPYLTPVPVGAAANASYVVARHTVRFIADQWGRQRGPACDTPGEHPGRSRHLVRFLSCDERGLSGFARPFCAFSDW